MLDRLSFRNQLIVFSVLAALLVFAGYSVWPGIGAQRSSITASRAQLADQQKKVQEGRLIEERLPELEREIAALKVKLEDVQQILPTDRETGDLLRWIKNLGDQSNLDLKSFSPGSLKPQEFYKEFPIEMQVVGRYHDLGIFLDRVSKYSRIINVDNLRIATAKESGKTITASFNATTFVYTDEPAVNREGRR